VSDKADLEQELKVLCHEERINFNAMITMFYAVDYLLHKYMEHTPEMGCDNH